MKIGISNDHAAVDLKIALKKYLEEKGYEVTDYGTNSTEAFDYPLAAIPLCEALQRKEVELGIAICGTGVGISISCNKFKGIRACCCSEATSAKLTRIHNHANVICFGARIVGEELAKDIVDVFLTTPESHEDRHVRRVQEMIDIENSQL